jgi:UDP:flavonoid glycosyltransferase YjiC (YdhE family)
MASTPLLGHTLPLLPICHGLVERGYDVTFLTATTLRDRIEPTGARFRALPGSADFDGTRVPELFPDFVRAGATGDNNDIAARDLFIPPLHDQFAALQEILAEGDPAGTVVLHEVFFHGTWPLMLGAPGLRPAGSIALGVSVLALGSSDTAPYGFGLPPDPSPEGVRRHRQLYEAEQRKYAPIQELLGLRLGELGAVKSAPLYWDAHSLLSHATLQLGPPGLEYPRAGMPGHIEFIGRVPDTVEDFTPPPWWGEVQQAEQVVFVTQGTVNNSDLDALIAPAMAALEGNDTLVVATLGGRPVPDSLRIPANARVASYLPYRAVLPYTDVMISNGGFGGVHTALSAGVPLIVAGQTEDKPDVTARVAWAGAGVNLRTGHPEPDALRAAVDTVLRDHAYRDAARRIQREYEERDAVENVARTIDRFIAGPQF